MIKFCADDVGLPDRRQEVRREVVLHLDRHVGVEVERAVREQDGDPVQDRVFRTGEVEHGKPGGPQLVGVRERGGAGALAGPLPRHLRVLRAVEAASVVVVRLAFRQGRLRHFDGRSVVEFHRLSS